MTFIKFLSKFSIFFYISKSSSFFLILLAEIHKLYQNIEKIGAGTYGIVYSAIDRITGERVALKVIKIESVEEGVPSTTIREISLLRELKHINIVNLIDVIHIEMELTLTFEFVDIDLAFYLDHYRKNLNNITIKSLLFQLLRGIAYCAQRRIIHRDIKPANLLINNRGILKIADFGLARAYKIPMSTQLSSNVASLWYRSPDLLLGNNQYGCELDVWSAGCIFAEMCSGSPPFQGRDPGSQLLDITKKLGSDCIDSLSNLSKYKKFVSSSPTFIKLPIEDVFPDIPTEFGYDLFLKMCQPNPSKRISAHDCLYHPFFNEICTN